MAPVTFRFDGILETEQEDCPVQSRGIELWKFGTDEGRVLAREVAVTEDIGHNEMGYGRVYAEKHGAQ